MGDLIEFPSAKMAGSNPALYATTSTTYGIPTKFLSKRARVRAAHGKSRKALANKDQSPLKGWEYPAGSGIRIREVINRYQGKDFGVSYRVSIPAKYAGKRVLKAWPPKTGPLPVRRFSVIDTVRSYEKRTSQHRTDRSYPSRQ